MSDTAGDSDSKEFFDVSFKAGVLTRGQLQKLNQSRSVSELLDQQPNIRREVEEASISLTSNTGDSYTSGSDQEGESAQLSTETMADRGNLIQPGKFRGDPEEMVSDYLTKFDRAARANGWDERRKAIVLPCYLEGAALKWYENLERTTADQTPTWEQIQVGMKSAFQTIAFDEQVEYRLRMRMQAEGESVDSYVQDVLSLCAQVDATMPEASKVRHILRGLSPSLIEKVMVMDNSSVAKLQDNIRKAQTARYLAGVRVDQLMGAGTSLFYPQQPPPATARPTPFQTTAPPTYANTSSLEHKVAELASAFDNLNMKVMNQTIQTRGQHYRGATARGNNYTSRPPYRDHFTRGGQRGNSTRGSENYRGTYRGNSRGSYRGREGRTADGRVICFNCGRAGHYAMACRSPSERQPSHQGNDHQEQ